MSCPRRQRCCSSALPMDRPTLTWQCSPCPTPPACSAPLSAFYPVLIFSNLCSAMRPSLTPRFKAAALHPTFTISPKPFPQWLTSSGKCPFWFLCHIRSQAPGFVFAFPQLHTLGRPLPRGAAVSWRLPVSVFHLGKCSVRGPRGAKGLGGLHCDSPRPKCHSHNWQPAHQ